ncbi:hypothetical protein ACFV2N_47235 [Streptomyces sp. NPDC059680]|uniref:hypothetical protein n=1 Tax=Streptomyces sp. NPDC059680 TaxID=3346904 RepID=UPI0036927961
MKFVASPLDLAGCRKRTVADLNVQAALDVAGCEEARSLWVIDIADYGRLLLEPPLEQRQPPIGRRQNADLDQQVASDAHHTCPFALAKLFGSCQGEQDRRSQHPAPCAA